MTTTPNARPNKFAGRCACGTFVAAEAGFLGPKVDGKWTVQCSKCLGAPVASPTEDRPTFDLTEEQQYAVELFASGCSIAVEAGAGTGKTSLLVAIAKSTHRFGTYTAFNVKIVDDGKGKFPGNVACSTSHSLAFGPVGRLYAHRLSSPRMRSDDIGRILGLGPINVPVIDDGGQPSVRVLQPSWQAGHVIAAAMKFCNTADLEVGVEHFSYIDGIDEPDAKGRRTYRWNDKVHADLVPALQAAWKDLMNPDGRLLTKHLVHSVYFKVWQLGDHGPFGKPPVIKGDFILVDEAQDTNACFADVLAQQEAQIVYVGDSAQELYGWRGSVNALSAVPAEQRAMLTISWRFDNKIATVANAILESVTGCDLRLEGRGAPSIIGRLDEPDAILCRTNAAAIDALMGEQQLGRATYLIGGGSDVEWFCRAARDLQQGRRTDHPDLGCFETWNEVEAYVEQDEQGADLELMVRMIKKYGADAIIEAIGQQSTESAADVIVSTIHKVKGMEWDRVRLGSDFMPNALDSRTESMLLYVGVTRARKHLDYTACEPVRKLMGAFGTVELDDEDEDVDDGPTGPIVIHGITDLMDRAR